MKALRRIPASVRSWAWSLAAVLVLVPLLGLMHNVVHGQQAHGRYGAAPVHASGDHEHEHGHVAATEDGWEDGGWLASLFSSHDGEPDCRLFDQASSDHAAIVLPLLSLPQVLCTVAFDISRGEALARWAALFDARGPPLSR